jgi:hypothetical protein
MGALDSLEFAAYKTNGSFCNNTNRQINNVLEKEKKRELAAGEQKEEEEWCCCYPPTKKKKKTSVGRRNRPQAHLEYVNCKGPVPNLFFLYCQRKKKISFSPF